VVSDEEEQELFSFNPNKLNKKTGVIILTFGGRKLAIQVIDVLRRKKRKGTDMFGSL